jgi:hypothetical protein
VTLSWQPSTSTYGAALTGYRLERATDAAFTQNLVRLDLGKATSYVDGAAAAGNTYFYRVAAMTLGGISDALALAPVRTPATLGSGGNQLASISARVFCGTGANVAIAGFSIPGPTSKRVLLRAIGPTLTTYGLSPADILADPMIELHDALNGNLTIALNDQVSDNANADDIAAAATRTGAAAVAPSDTTSAALLVTLPPGAYTFVTLGKNSSSGVVLMEVYDAD